MRAKCITFSVLLLTCFAFNSWGDVCLPLLFADHMVLQQGMNVPVWGWAAPGERVSVSFRSQHLAAIADSNGEWKVTLSPLSAGGPFELTVIGRNTNTIWDVLVGDVWLCSGQSNMAWPVGSSRNAIEEIARANYPRMRLFTVWNMPSASRQRDATGEWVACISGTVSNFSAVAYFFGRQLHRELKTPIGLINNAWGGTPAEAWTSIETMASNPVLMPILDDCEELLTNVPLCGPRQCKVETVLTTRKPRQPMGPSNPCSPAGLYHGRICSLMPFALRGVIWYQGESNAGRAEQYRTLFPAMIRNWRAEWGQGDFPFLFVQLANFMRRGKQPGESALAELREAQLMTLEITNTAMAVAIDVGEAGDIHPRNKQDVGRRLALAALAVAHGRELVHTGPRYSHMAVAGGKIRLHFTDVGSGPFDIPLKGFAIAGEDKAFVWANAKVDGNTVLVWSDEVENPVAVRYGWADNPECNLYNREGLPASPFRTDDWP